MARIVALLLLATCASAFSPASMPGAGARLALRAAPRASGLVHGARSARRGTALAMVTPEEEAAFRAREDAEIARRRAEEEENERKYIQQSSGLNYRQNEQDSLIFAMGALIIVLPVVFVGIAIATGYIPLDYLRN